MEAGADRGVASTGYITNGDYRGRGEGRGGTHGGYVLCDDRANVLFREW